MILRSRDALNPKRQKTLPFLLFALMCLSAPSLAANSQPLQTEAHSDEQQRSAPFEEAESGLQRTMPSFFEDEIEDKNETTPSLPSFESLLIKTIIMLGFLISALMAGMWFLKRLHGPQFQKGAAEKTRIDLIERKYLSAKTTLWYVHVEGIPHIVVESQHGVAISPALQRVSEHNADRERTF